VADALTSSLQSAIQRRYFDDPNADPNALMQSYLNDPSYLGSGPPTAPVAGSNTSGSSVPTPNDPYASSLSTDQNQYYDPTYENTMSGITANQNDINSQYSQAVQKLRTSMQAPLQQAQQSYQDQLNMLSGQMAQQGILRSSNNLYGQGRLNTDYLNQVGQMNLQQQQQQEALDRNRASYLQQLLQQGVQASGAHAAFESDQAKQSSLTQAQAQAAQDAAQRQMLYNQQLQAQTQASGQGFEDAVLGQQYRTPGANQYSMGQVVNPANNENIVSSQFDPLYGWLNLTSLGGVYTGGGGAGVGIGGNNYGGSYLGYAGQTADPNAEIGAHGDFSQGGLTINPDMSYTLANTLGEKYNFSPQQLDPAIRRRLGL
jgi:hypothetical protein